MSLSYAFDPGFRAIPGSSSPLELREMIQNPFRFLEERYLKHGAIFRSSVAYPCVWMIGPEANRTIMVTERDKFSYEGGYGKLAFAKLFPKNILLMDGETHAKTRAILEPAVSRLGLEESIGPVQDIWNRHAETLAGRAPEDVYVVAQKATYEVSARVLAGLRDSDEIEELRPYFEAVIAGAMAHTQLRFPGGTLDKAMKARDVLYARLMPYVKRARGASERFGVLGLLTEYRDANGRPLPDEEVLHQVLLLYWAGYDTTASAGSWVIHHLAHQAEWQRRLREEVFEVLGDEPYQLTGSSKLRQVSWFLREIERCGPSLFMFPRAASADFEFQGYRVPAGTPVFYSPWMSHRCPESFPHPHTFDPGRWDPALGNDQAKGKYMVGFGGGPRLCLGRSFAQMQLRIMVTTLVRRYHIEPDATTEFHIMGLPVHHPVDSRVRFRELLDHQRPQRRAPEQDKGLAAAPPS